jgi:hypothetical protein
MSRMYNEVTVVSSLDEFKRNFDTFTADLLSGLDWSHLLCAGGCALGTTSNTNNDNFLACLVSNLEGKTQSELQHHFQTESAYKQSDVDIFLYGYTSEKEKEYLEKVLCTW